MPSNYPNGTWQGDPRAPWNQPDPPEKCPECGQDPDDRGRDDDGDPCTHPCHDKEEG